MARVVKKRKPDPKPASPLAALMEPHLEALRLQNYSEYTMKNRRVHIGFFLDWADERGLVDPLDIPVRSWRATNAICFITAKRRTASR